MFIEIEQGFVHQRFLGLKEYAPETPTGTIDVLVLEPYETPLFLMALISHLLYEYLLEECLYECPDLKYVRLF